MRSLDLSGRTTGAGRWAGAPAALLLGLGLLAGDVPALQAQGAQPDPWVAPERRARQPNPLESTPQVVAQGKRLYERECLSCHGATGANDGEKAPEEMRTARKLSDATLRDETDGALFWKIGEGRDKMPSTWDVLQDRERWSVVIYIRTLAPAPPPGRSP